ncbi:D-tyrosyl-tRNA(Tyr) deacylase 2-like [Oopsacas minuta]|uniref:D-aminoacyl-tRNA deacylase n=1 Tax=Oopsacas minuta TaxID=111878 RepID=A0AAV7JB00_9METZ|nr:D-tyrosyl-tRNA(Tyr) deacylase 2-like [Oopsacas minuta]
MATEKLDTSTEPTVKLLIQQCISAKLQVKPPSADGIADGEFVTIEKGIVAYVSFLKSATVESVTRAANITLNVKLSYDEATSKLQSALDTNGDVLIIPQACLGGKLKGKSFQYHNLMAKDDSHALYQVYIDQCKQIMAANSVKSSLQHGTYGNRQVLSVVTNGPFTHVIDV